ncbi:S1 RNA-binding domain-containing protein [bacterium]|nr:S1 RNA-binding domain-containing protein [bacterium]
MIKEQEDKNKQDFSKLLEKDTIEVPKVGDIVTGIVISSSKSEVKLDIDGVLVGVVRGPQLYDELDEYSELKLGDQVDATVMEEENENGELELSFKQAGQEKAWSTLRKSFANKDDVLVKIIEANKGGLIAHYKQIPGFLPVSQLSPENYPRVSGGDQGKILDKLKSFVGIELEVKVITLEEEEDKIIFSEKDVWAEKQKDVIAKYEVSTVIEGRVTAVTDFGVFVSFDEKMEGLIHISELAWQRIDDPSDFYNVGDKIKAKVISVEGSKIFLSAKRLKKDPWEEAGKKYKVGQEVEGEVMKINPFGLFVKLDKSIHGLAHISQLGITKGEKLDDNFKLGEKYNFKITSLVPEEYRLGLKMFDKSKKVKEEKKEEKKKEGGKKEESPKDSGGDKKKESKKDKTEK